MAYYHRRLSMNCNLEGPPHSRLFVVGSKLLSEDDFRTAFEQFGRIEEIRMVKDRQSGENKGVTYIKYSKTSEAAKALESMNGKYIGNSNRSIRVMIAASRDEGSKRESNEDEKLLRLFVVVSKAMTDLELLDYFGIFGDVDYATIMRDRETRQSKGFAYVKYFKFSHAAAAFEKCDSKYRAVFAEPRKPNIKAEEKCLVSSNSVNNIIIPHVANPNGYTKLIAIVSPNLNQDQVWKLFDIVPGMDYCHLRWEGQPTPDKGIASVVYNNSQSAAYAKEKLHGFEYPPGNRIIVKPDCEDKQYFDTAVVSCSERQKHADLFQIAETIAHASNLIQASGISQDALQARLGLVPKDGEVKCSVSLPSAQPLASLDEETVARCFIVCTPTPLPNAVLKNVFSRFGFLIDVYMFKNRNCGFAKYASQESAETAIKTLHGADVCGIRIKVLRAEEKQDCNRKRQRLDEKS